MSIFSKFNQSNTCLVISDYPERDRHGEKNYGIAWYTKETLEPIARKFNQRFVVLAEKDGKIGPAYYAGGKIMVLRVFDPNHHTLFPVILKWLLKFSNIKKVYVHSEFCTNGGIKNFALLIPFLLIIKLFRREVIYFAHNVLDSFDEISPHLNLGNNKLKISLLNLCLVFYYRLLGLVSDWIVVMDEAIKLRINKFVPERKLVYQPFWVKVDNKTNSRSEARKSLGVKNNEFLILYFGFITWYKGADWIIDQIRNSKFETRNKNIKLILAGGPAYSLKDKKYYQDYYKEQLEKVKSSKNIEITGFVKEKDIGKYFLASDLVVFPYRGLIGSSAALNFAIQYKKPFLVSDRMRVIFKNREFAKALTEVNLGQKDIMFALNLDSFKLILKEVRNKKILKKLEQLSLSLSKKRNFYNLLDKYNEEIFRKNQNLSAFASSSGYETYQLATKQI